MAMTSQHFGERESSLDIDFLFDFEQWIHRHGLVDIKAVFVDFAMCVPQSLHFQNPQFSKLLADQRVVSSPDLIPRIISAVQSLQETQKGTVLLVSNAENDALVQIKQLIENMHSLRDTFASISGKYKEKKALNQQQIMNYIHCNSECLSQRHKDITESFTVLFNMLEARELAMRTKIEEYTQRFNRFHVEHRKVTNVLDSKLKETELTIQHDLNHMKEQEMYCTEIIRDYNNHLSARKVQTDRSRESKILKICQHTQACYDEALQFIRKNQDEIVAFAERHIPFDVDLNALPERQQQIYWVNLDKALFDSIRNHIPRFIDIFSVDEEGYAKAMATQTATAATRSLPKTQHLSSSTSPVVVAMPQPGAKPSTSAALSFSALVQKSIESPKALSPNPQHPKPPIPLNTGNAVTVHPPKSKKLKMQHFVTRGHVRSCAPTNPKAPAGPSRKASRRSTRAMATETETDNRIDVPKAQSTDKCVETDNVRVVDTGHRQSDVSGDSIMSKPVEGMRNGGNLEDKGQELRVEAISVSGSVVDTKNPPKKQNGKKKKQGKKQNKEMNRLKSELKTMERAMTKLRKSKEILITDETALEALRNEIKELRDKLKRQHFEHQRVIKGMEDGGNAKGPVLDAPVCSSTVPGDTHYIDQWDEKHTDGGRWKCLPPSNKRIRGVWSAPKGVCQKRGWFAFLEFEGRDSMEGIWSCSIKRDRPTVVGGGQGYIPGHIASPVCIGISNYRQHPGVKKGVECGKRWPDWAHTSRFDGSAMPPYWYINEVVTIKVDMTNREVYYFKDHQLIQKDALTIQGPVYIMLSGAAIAHARFNYTIVNPPNVNDSQCQ